MSVTETPTTVQPVLEIRHISKTFPGQKALDDVSMSFAAGEIQGLVGHNVLGKSTLVKILAGYYAPDVGAEVSIGGSPSEPKIFKSRDLAIAFVHQDLALWDSMSVLENFFQGVYRRKASGRIDWRGHHREARDWLQKFGLDVRLDAPVRALSAPDMAMLAVIRAAHQAHNAGCGLLVLDEPTPYLPADGVDRLFEVVRRVAAEGNSVLFIGHDLQEVINHADRVTVLRDGQIVGSHRKGSNITVQMLSNELMGKEQSERYRKVGRQGQERLSLQNAQGPGLQNISFSLHAGEVLGVTGLLGSGFDRVPYVAFGAEPKAHGQIRLGEECAKLSNINPGWSVRKGMALVPGNRTLQGGLVTYPATANITMQKLRSLTRRGRHLSRRSQEQCADDLMGRYEVRPSTRERNFGLFSGGNQQKIILAKWLSTSPKVVLMHEPMAGIDIGTKREIFNEIRRVADDGVGVLIATTDYEDLVEVCDRVLVVRKGRIEEELSGERLTKKRLLTACVAAEDR